MEVYLHRFNLLNFLFRVLFVSFISYDTLHNEVCMFFFLCITFPVVRIEFTVVILNFGIEDFTDPGLLKIRLTSLVMSL